MKKSLTKKFAFTRKDLFKGNFHLNSKYFKEDMLSQTYLSMKCFPNSKSYFQQDFSLQITALFSRHGNITMVLQAKHDLWISFSKYQVSFQREDPFRSTFFHNSIFKIWDPFVKHFFEWQLSFHRNLPLSKTSNYILNDKYFCKEAITVSKKYLLKCSFLLQRRQSLKYQFIYVLKCQYSLPRRHPLK